MNANVCKRNDGVALLIAVIFVAVAVLVLSGLASRAVQQGQQNAQFEGFNDCFPGLDAALAESWVDLEAGGNGMVGIGTWVAPVGATSVVLPDFDDTLVLPASMSTMPGVQYMAYVQDWQNDGIDNNGNGTADGADEAFMYSVYALARNRGITRRAEAVLQGQDVNVWRNAIFAGSGQSGGLINGNVSIHGSVHLLGDNLTSGSTAMSAIDMSGTSLIHNNYVGLPADLSGRIPALPTRTFNGETVSTLNAKLRVRNGLVGMSGNSEIGELDVVGNTLKETMDGTYVNDGWTGNSVIDDGDRGDPTAVYSDNGWDNPYDLGTRLSLPLLSDPYKELNTGTQYMNPSTGTWYTHTEYFQQVLTGTPYSGNMTIRANQNFYYNATRPSDTDPTLRLPTDDYIYFNATTNVMEVNGQIQINGNLAIDRGNGNDKTISYTGRAAILVHGDVSLDTDLLAQNADGTTSNSFPVNNILGIMAQGSMTMGTNSQLKLMGAFYAQNQIRSTKQTTVTGTYVSNYFDMGTNVPEIYQVPSLADNLPLGMIGAYPILVYSQVSWRELGA
jgi:hypothetical protein